MPVYKDKERGSWTCSFRYKDWTGATKRKLKRGFASKKEALDFEARFKLSSDANMDMLLEDFIEVYFQDKEAELKNRTKNNKRYMIERHIIPFLGKKRMNEVAPSDILAWQGEIIAKGYSESYMRMLQNQISAIFIHANKIYNLANNPCKKVKKIGKSDVRRLEFWTLEEYKQFIETFEKRTRGYLMFEILFWTGCREGEMLALTKKDIDLIGQKLHINKTIYRINGKNHITTPKTEESVRTVIIPKFLCNEIEDYFNALYEYPDDELLFPICERAVETMMDRHIKMAGVKKIAVHCLRHSNCAYLISHGVEPMIIKERLGHKDIRITLNTYGHLYPSEQRKVSDMMDRMFEEDNKGNTLE